ncbi:PAS domain S-box protein, partial [Patescibacteria group bacterium]|nr:PAS domain S-box protein [Patescibacteria group bacterium]
RIYDEKYLHELFQLYLHKFRNRKFDVIISSDDHAFNFLLSHYAELFADTPVVFCGVNYFRDKMLDGYDLITGVVESFSIKGTIDVALQINPAIQKVFAIVDNTVTGKANKKLLLELTPQYENLLEFNFFENLDMSEVQARVRDLPDNSIVLLLHFTSDRSGNFFSLEESADLISEYSNSPMYSFWDFHLDHGIVGGKLTSGFAHGEMAANMALRIINGVAVDKIPVLKESPNRYIFDYRKMQQFGINLSQLPDESFVINKPYSFYAQNKRLFWKIVAAILCLVLIVIGFTINLFKRRTAEKALRVSEERFRELAELLPMPIYEMDATGKLTFANKGAFDYFGYTQEDFIQGLSGQDMIAPEDRKRAGENIQRVLHGEQLTLKEYTALKKDGNTFPALANSATIIHDGKPAGLRGFIIDITELKQAEEKLRKYEHIVSTTSDLMSFLDTNYIYQAVNGAYLKAHLKKYEKIVGHSIAELYKPGVFSDVIKDKVDRCLDGEEIKYQDWFDYPGLGRRFMDIIYTPYMDHRGSISGMVVNARDITEREIAEEALRESEEKYRSILESIEDGYYEVGLAGNFTFFNDAMCKILKYPADELMGMNNREYMDEENAKKIYKVFNTIYQTGVSTKALDWKLIRKDGTECFVETAVSLIKGPNGQPIGFRGIARDITGRKLAEEERKKLESQLYQAERMESLGTLAGGIAHDFNNFLMGIQGRTSLMLMDIDSSYPHFEHLKGIEAYVKSLAELTTQLLGFARGGKYELKPTDLNTLVKKQNHMFGRTKKEIIIHEKLEKNLWAAEVDQGQIEQVLLNLYVNAWQAMPGGGDLYVQTECITIDENYGKPIQLEPGRYVKISITDTGVGMDEATRQRIFDPFFTTKEMGRGTGLGLASAYGIIKNHGGMINVYSEKGLGTTFNIYLPAS